MKLGNKGERLHQLYVIVMFLMLARFFRFTYFEENFPLIKTLYAKSSQVCAIVVLGIFALRFRRKLSALHIAIAGVFALLLLSTLISGGNLRRVVSAAYPPIALVLFVTMECSDRNRAKGFVRILANLFVFFVGLNTLLMLFVPELFGHTATTDGKIFLLGLENSVGYTLVAGLIVVLANDHLNHESWKTQLYAVCYALSTVVNFSVGSLMGSAVLLLYLLRPVRRVFEKKPFMVFAGAVLGICVILVLWGETVLSFPPFRFIIEDILHKDVTLTHRTTIWQVAMEGLAKRPVFGYGYGDSVNLFTIQVWGEEKTYSAHNQFVQTVYEGGFAALIAVASVVYLAGKVFSASSNRRFAAECKAVAVTLMVMYLTEAPGLDVLFFVLSFGAALIIMTNNYQLEVSKQLNAPVELREEKITVVIPVYNVEQYLPACLDSVTGQTYRNLEIIVVNDGSTDGSLAICRRYAQADPRIILIDQENQGLSGARNSGIRAATGKYITFVDSDDAIETEMVEYLYRLIVNCDGDMSVCQRQFVDEEGREIADSQVYQDKLFRGKEACMKAFFRDGELSVTAWGKLYKTAAFEKVEYAVGKYHEDVYTTYRLVAQCDTIAAGAERKYFYRQRSGSIVHEGFSAKHLDAVEGSELQAAFVQQHYPALKKDARAKVIWACNSCAMRLKNTPQPDPKAIGYLQERYRKYEGDFLLGNYRLAAKLFSLCAWVDLKTTLALLTKVSDIRRKIIK